MHSVKSNKSNNRFSDKNLAKKEKLISDYYNHHKNKDYSKHSDTKNANSKKNNTK